MASEKTPWIRPYHDHIKNYCSVLFRRFNLVFPLFFLLIVGIFLTQVQNTVFNNIIQCKWRVHVILCITHKTIVNVAVDVVCCATFIQIYYCYVLIHCSVTPVCCMKSQACYSDKSFFFYAGDTMKLVWHIFLTF